MKIAVASENIMVSQHFGHCESFNIFETENKKIIKSECIPSPGHESGILPQFLKDMGVKIVISGGMGAGAREVLKEKEIEVITGAKGSAEDAVNSYLQGELKSTEVVCHEHKHHNEGCES